MPELNTKNIINSLKDFTDKHNIDSLFVVGEYPLGIYKSEKSQIKHIEVISAFDDQYEILGKIFASEVLQISPVETGYSVSIDTGKVKLEFQAFSNKSYMSNEEILEWMKSKNIENTAINNNLLGREFTIHTLLYSIKTDNIFDPLGIATKDINDKVLRSILPADILLKYSPDAAIRAIDLTCKYDLHIDSLLLKSIQGIQPQLAACWTNERILAEIVRIVKKYNKVGLDILKKTKLDHYLLMPNAKHYLDKD